MPCTKRQPFYGFVKRAMNRAPGPSDKWWGQHKQNCEGTFVKVKEPEGFLKKGKKVSNKIEATETSGISGFSGGKENKGKNSSGMPKGLWDANEVRSTEVWNKDGNEGEGPGVSGGLLKRI